eukprot:COSAG02_NODE_282_length_25773_cov_1666.149762_7_plen_463_part_00
MILTPEPVGQRDEGGGDVLSTSQCVAWHSDGAVFVSELLPGPLLSAAVEAGVRLDDAERSRPLRFPHTGRIAVNNDVALEPRILRAAAQLLGVQDDELRLIQSVVHADFAGQASGEADLSMHCEFEKNSLVALPAEAEAVHIILSLDDVLQSGGATTFTTSSGDERTAHHAVGSALLLKMDTPWCQDAVTPPVSDDLVSTSSSGGQVDHGTTVEVAGNQLLVELTEVMRKHDLPLAILDTLVSEIEYSLEGPDDIAEALATLVKRLMDAGNATDSIELFINQKMKQLENLAGNASAVGPASGGVVPGRRLSQHIILRKANAEWISNEAFIRNLSSQGPWIATLSAMQRTVLGFPAPGHSFWRQPTALSQAVGRYPEMDPEPYITAGAAPLVPFTYGPRLPLTGESSTTEEGLFPPPIDRMVFPEPVQGKGDLVLSSSQVSQFREQGWLLVDGIWPSELVDAA